MKMSPIERLRNYVTAWAKLGRIRQITNATYDKVQAHGHALEDHQRALEDHQHASSNQQRALEDHQHALEDQRRALDDLHHEIFARLDGLSENINNVIATSQQRQARFENDLHGQMMAPLEDVQSRLATLSRLYAGTIPPAAPAGDTPPPPEIAGDLAAVETYFRERLAQHVTPLQDALSQDLRAQIPDIEAAVIRTQGASVLDLSTGGSAWPLILSQVDLPQAPWEPTTDLITQLEALHESSIACVLAYHTFDDAPLTSVLQATRAILRVLAPGGVIIIGALNAQSLTAATEVLYSDPGSARPVTRPVLQALLETFGFDPIEIRAQAPDRRLSEALAHPHADGQVASALFGPRLLVAIGTKPLSEPT